MENKEFDDIIKKKLESLNANTSDDWDMFKQKWDQESDTHENEQDSTEDAELDAKIKEDMQGLRMPFNSKHWILLKEQLELEALFKKRLFFAKSFEILILAFLVVGILNLWPIQKDIYEIPVYDIPMVASLPVDKVTAQQFEASESLRLKQQESIKKELIRSTQKVFSNTFGSIDVASNDKSNTKEKSTSTLLSEDDKPLDSKLNNGKIDFPFIPVKTDIHIEENQTLDQGIVSASQTFAKLDNSSLTLLDLPKRPIGFPDIDLGKEIIQEDGGTFLSIAIGPKVNLVNSPLDPVYGFDPYNTLNTNFSVSAKIHKEVGPLEVYAGLGFTNTSYQPKLHKEVYKQLESQYNSATLDNIEFKTINIPIGVRYNIVNNDNFQFYTAGGIDMNIIGDSDYEIEDLPVGGGRGPAAPPSPKNIVNENALLSQKEFNKGIFKGGKLGDNLYTTATVSLGLSTSLSQRMGIYIEPKYSHFISSKGIGPNADKVHGLSLDFGVRYNLN